MNNTEAKNISTGERVIRMAVTAGLIGTVLTHSGDLGYLTLLPLMSVYTGLTAFIGWDPVVAAAQTLKQSSAAQSVSRHQIASAH